MTFKVMAVSQEEYAKADADETYAPQEHCAGRIEAPSESQALRKLANAVKRGEFPKGSVLELS